MEFGFCIGFDEVSIDVLVFDKLLDLDDADALGVDEFGGYGGCHLTGVGEVADLRATPCFTHRSGDIFS